MPYTLEQNGSAKWKKTSVQECGKNMLKQVKLLNYFWAEVIWTAIYLQNKIPMKVIVGKTLEEMWTNEQPYGAHLKVFCCQT